MDLHTLLTEARAQVLDEACTALERCKVAHYQAMGESVTRRRLEDLFSVVLEAMRDHEPASLNSYCERLAEERFAEGFGIPELQTAFNVLEEAMWRQIVARTPRDHLATAVGQLGSVLGYGKDVVARRYVELASRRHAPALDVSALLAGAHS